MKNRMASEQWFTLTDLYMKAFGLLDRSSVWDTTEMLPLEQFRKASLQKMESKVMVSKDKKMELFTVDPSIMESIKESAI